jgi:hypothetical protein
MPGVDFLSDLESEQPKPVVSKKGTGAFFIVLIISAVVVLGAYAIIKIQEQDVQDQTETVTEEIKAVRIKIDSQREDLNKALAFQKQLGNFNELIENHIYWTKAFKVIGDNTLKKVVFSQFNGTVQTRQVSMQGKAPTYLDVAKQYVAFQQAGDVEKAIFSDVNLQTGEDGGVMFNVAVTLNPRSFRY